MPVGRIPEASDIRAVLCLAGTSSDGGLRMKTIKQRLLDALTTEGQSYEELAAKIGGNPAIRYMNRYLTQLEAEGLAVRYKPERARFSGRKPVDRMHSPKVLWRLA